MGTKVLVSDLNRNSLATDPKQVELVIKLTDKTQRGKIAWERGANSLAASVSGTMFLNFVLSPTFPVGIQSWDLFTVREGRMSKELVKVQNSEGLGLAFLVTGTESSLPDPLVAATRQLFAAAANNARGEIERAIELVDKL